MSRIGKKVIPIPKGTTITKKDNRFEVKGPKGTLHVDCIDGISVEIGETEVKVINADEQRSNSRAMHGLLRSLLANAVHGVSVGFTKKMELTGVGYKAEVKNNGLEMALGYSHPVIMPFPEGVSAEIDKKTNVISVHGVDKQVLGQYCANVREKRPPEPYKGKGFHYAGEKIRRKSGKSV